MCSLKLRPSKFKDKNWKSLALDKGFCLWLFFGAKAIFLSMFDFDTLFTVVKSVKCIPKSNAKKSWKMCIKSWMNNQSCPNIWWASHISTSSFDGTGSLFKGIFYNFLDEIFHNQFIFEATALLSSCDDLPNSKWLDQVWVNTSARSQIEFLYEKIHKFELGID